MKPKKSLGQNFLIHKAICERIVIASGVKENDIVLEIGPGRGILTRALLKQVKKVIAVETDPDLIPLLEEAFSFEIESGRLLLIHSDIRNLDASVLPSEFHLVANIPYYITGEIIRGFLSAPHKPRSMTLLVQKEVAKRITSKGKESLLSLSVKLYGVPKYCFTVSRGAFSPAPSVDSAVLSIQNISQSGYTTEQEAAFFELLHTGFGQKRKMLANNLEALYSQERIDDAFTTAKLNKKIRSEDMSLVQWKLLFEHLN
jgi:16S rRNA (adenine1518-N6/adenine1519-N6)-dimethyltransferase